jgi:trimethylamine--corrinoid protein Co-methyltransferase
VTAIRPRVEVLSQDLIQSILDDAFVILARSGVMVENMEAQKLLLEAGAKIENGRVKISGELIEKCLKTVPSSIQLYDRFGELRADLGGDRSHFDPGSAALKILDYETGELRAGKINDVVRFTTLIDTLPNFAAQSTGVVPSDVPPEVSDSIRLFIALTHGTKPVVTGTFKRGSFDVMKRMLVAVRGSEKALREKPLAIFDCCPSPPLMWSDLTCQDLIDCARAGIPAELVSMPLTGATAPISLHGAVVQHCAEDLSGIVIHQLAGPGSPIIYGGSPALFDMRNATTPMGAIETMMIDAAYAQVGKHLGLPTHAYMGLSDAKVVDAQAGFESGMGALMAVLAGVNMISGPGMLDFENAQSLEKLAIDHEICGMALRLARGIEPREGATIPELMEALLRDGNLLSHPHTLRWFKEEAYYPSKIVDRMTDESSQKQSSRTALARAHDFVEKTLQTHQTAPLDSAVRRGIEGIMDSHLQRFGVRLPDLLIG